MKTLVSIIVILFAVSCSNKKDEIKKLTDSNTKLQTENKKLKPELDDWKLKYHRLLAQDRKTEKTLRELEIEKLVQLGLQQHCGPA